MDNSHSGSRKSISNKELTKNAAISAKRNITNNETTMQTGHFFGAALEPRILDFNKQANIYKKSLVKGRALKMLIIFGIAIVTISILLATVGLYLNNKYSGKALPYTYVGNVSVGGLTESEIKSALDKKAEEMRVTFVEGGLERSVLLAELDARYDTDVASKKAIVNFNPFEYLNKRVFSVPVEINEKHVDAYLTLNVANMQTKSKNAEIVKTREGFSVKPELIGFRTNSTYITDQLREKLPKMEDPVINLSASTEKPSITEADLADDIEKAKQMIATDVALQVWNTKITPKEEEKMSWLEMTSKENGEILLSFNKNKVENYVNAMAKKYSFAKEDEHIITHEDGSQSIKEGKNGQNVKNAKEIAEKFYNALISGQAGVFKFEFEYKEYVKVDREGLVLASPNSDVSNEAQLESSREADSSVESSQDQVVSGNNNDQN